jgi:ABC-type dipeptide/oligopeptide/nickel transport system permease component
VILEKIFAWPGLGRLLVDSVLSYDLPVVQGCVLLTGGAFVVINFVADIVQLYVEPRIDPEAVI